MRAAPFAFVSDRLLFGRLAASAADVLDAGVDLLPDFGLAAVSVLDGTERPAEVPAVRRRLRAEGIRVCEHRGVLLLTPGDLDHLCSVGLFGGNDELYFATEWDEEFECFPGGRITSDHHDFNEGTPLGLEEWMIDSGCLLALGDSDGLNFATLDPKLAKKLKARFKTSKR